LYDDILRCQIGFGRYTQIIDLLLQLVTAQAIVEMDERFRAARAFSISTMLAGFHDFTATETTAWFIPVKLHV
jgi:hypothetical protein